jgi:hypothetical protein
LLRISNRVFSENVTDEIGEHRLIGNFMGLLIMKDHAIVFKVVLNVGVASTKSSRDTKQARLSLRILEVSDGCSAVGAVMVYSLLRASPLF